MPLASITRLRARSIRHMPEFLWRAFASVRREVKPVFWTRTVWRDEAAMRAFMANGAHRVVMPKILDWCDEA